MRISIAEVDSVSAPFCSRDSGRGGGLGDLERLESVTPLMEAYESVESAGDKGCHTRITIVRALGQIGAATAEPIIRRALNAIQIETVGSGREDTALTSAPTLPSPSRVWTRRMPSTTSP